MKKSNWIILGAIALITSLFLLKKCGNAGNGVAPSKAVTIEKKTVEGEEIKTGGIEPDTLDRSGETLPDVLSLLEERDLFFQRYQHYKKEALELERQMAELSNQIASVTDCEELAALKAEQIDRLRSKAARDSAVIEELFAAYDEGGEARIYRGEVEGEHFRTEWEATVFGVMPKNGLLLKTDVDQITTTIREPFEVWRKNTVEAFTGYELSGDGYLLGLGYERRGKRLGVFGQGDYQPETKKIQGRAGLRLHF